MDTNMKFIVNRENCILKCEIRGSGLPLILIHGVASDAKYFEQAAEKLADDFSVITYDRRGYSESTADENADYSVRTQAEDAYCVIKAAGLEKIAVAGCSAGGIIALELAYQYPENVEKMLLHEPPIAMTEKSRKKIDDWLIELEEDAKKRRLTKAMLHFFKAIGGTDPTAKSQPLERQAQNLENMKTFLYHELHEFLTYYKKLDKDRIPAADTTIASGMEDVNGIFSAAGIETANIMGVRSLSVPGYHNLPNERPEVFAGIIKEWRMK